MSTDPKWDEAKVLAKKLLDGAREVPYAKARGCNRSPFAPLRVPEGLLFPIESMTRSDGIVIKRWRFGHPTDGPIIYESPQVLLRMETFELKPMEMPKGALFFLDYPHDEKESED